MFAIENRGYIEEGYYADVVLVNLNETTEVKKDNLFYKCGWSPFEGYTFSSKIEKTFVNGYLVYDNGKVNEELHSMRLKFKRK